VGKDLKVIAFASAVCLVCSLILAGVYSSLKAEQELNRVIDMKSKVLSSFGVDVEEMNTREIENLFSSQVESKVLNSSGEIVDVNIGDLTDDQINIRDNEGYKQYYPLYIYTDSVSGKKLYGIHISGKGLWSVIKGYLALEEDLCTIAGIAFYEHLETPGLGGEIEKPFFRDRFKGKTFLQGGDVTRFRIIKPGAKGDDHCVDAITAATMTCKGVEEFLNEDFVVYNKYFERLRK